MTQDLYTGVLARPKLATTRLEAGDIGGAFTSLVRPQEIPPSQQKTLADEWGVSSDTWYGKILRTVENPIVLVGLVLAAKYPIPTLANMFKYSEKLEGLARRPGIIRRWVGDVDATFHGLAAGESTLPTEIRSLVQKTQVFREERGLEVAQAIANFEKDGGVFDRRTQDLLVAASKGWHVSGKINLNEGPGFQKLLDTTQGVFSDIYDRTWGALDRASLNAALKDQNLSQSQFIKLMDQRDTLKAAGQDVTSIDNLLSPVFKLQDTARSNLLQQLRASGINTASWGKVARQEFYFPEQGTRNLLQDFDRSLGPLVELTEQDVLKGKTRSTAMAGYTPYGLPKRGKMVPDPDFLDRLKSYGVLTDNTWPDKIRMALQDSPSLRTWNPNFQDAFSSYIQSMARGYAWTIEGHGSNIVDALRELKASPLPHNKVRASMLENGYIPAALGRMTVRQLEASAEWDSMKLDLIQNLNTGRLSEVLPGDMKNWFSEKLASDQGIFNWRNIQGRIAAHLTVGALGMNPVAATWNMMQTLLTTVPVIGAQSTFSGMGRVLKQAPKYFEFRQQGYLPQVALAKAFPTFAKAGLEAAPFTSEILAGLEDSWAMSANLPANMKHPVTRAKNAMMALFRTTENFVRLTAFEGTMAKGLKEGMDVSEILPMAKRVTEATQFLSGPVNSPYMFLNRSPLISQFGRFPARYLDFLMGTATEIGSGENSGMFGRNWGTLGRALLTTGVAYETGEQLFDQDWSGGLMSGALPAGSPGGILSPLPWVPPAIGLGASALQALTGDTAPLRRSLPLLVPGGVAMSRAATAFAPSVAEFVGRQYADYENTLPDGRVGMYSTGGTLVGYLSPMQLYMKALGIPPTGPEVMQHEAELSRYIYAQRDRMASIKHQFGEAVINNNIPDQQEAQSTWKQLYPGFGPLRLTPQEERAMQLKHMIPRLERQLDSLPADARPAFGQLIQTALSEETGNLMGVDPIMFSMQGSNITNRMPYRQQPVQDIISQMQMRAHGSYLNQ